MLLHEEYEQFIRAEACTGTKRANDFAEREGREGNYQEALSSFPFLSDNSFPHLSYLFIPLQWRKQAARNVDPLRLLGTVVAEELCVLSDVLKQLQNEKGFAASYIAHNFDAARKAADGCKAQREIGVDNVSVNDRGVVRTVNSADLSCSCRGPQRNGFVCPHIVSAFDFLHTDLIHRRLPEEAGQLRHRYNDGMFHKQYQVDVIRAALNSIKGPVGPVDVRALREFSPPTPLTAPISNVQPGGQRDKAGRRSSHAEVEALENEREARNVYLADCSRLKLESKFANRLASETADAAAIARYKALAKTLTATTWAPQDCGRSGISNPTGTICWANSVLQALRHMTSLVAEAAARVAHSCEEECIACAIPSFLVVLANSTGPPLANPIAHPGFSQHLSSHLNLNPRRYQSAAEFLHLLHTPLLETHRNGLQSEDSFFNSCLVDHTTTRVCERRHESCHVKVTPIVQVGAPEVSAGGLSVALEQTNKFENNCYECPRDSPFSLWTEKLKSTIRPSTHTLILSLEYGERVPFWGSLSIDQQLFLEHHEFKLSAVVVHENNHYFCLGKCGDGWRMYSDQLMTSVRIDNYIHRWKYQTNCPSASTWSSSAGVSRLADPFQRPCLLFYARAPATSNIREV